MIRLTRLDGSEIYLNPDLTETIEENPDTHIALLNGNRYLVLEPARVIIARIIALKAKIRRRCISGMEKRYLRRHAAESYRPVCKL